LTQQDLLAKLRSVLSVRSDSFVIRAKGVHGAGANASEAWLELHVRRNADYVDPANPPHTPVDPEEAELAGLSALHPVNLRFGRRFEITHSRWITSEEAP
jgi:hypothetical protein